MPQPPETSSSSKPLIAAIASAIIPGVGQFIVGDRRRGSVLIGVNVVILIGLYLYMGDALTLAKMWLQPTQLAIMMMGNIILLGYRVWAADDAYRTGKARNRNATLSRGLLLGAGAALIIVLALPHAVFAYYDVIQYDLITTVFASNSPTSTTPTVPDSSPPDTTVDGDPVETTTTTQAPAANFWENHERVNILLIGGDFGVGRTGIRTDTMITVSIDPVSGETAMFSIPRNWTQSPLPEGMGVWDCNCYPELINELWVAGETYPDAFPGPSDNPSVNAVKGVISEFLGIPIHYYAMVNLDGFVEMIDALGGVEVYVPEAVYDAEYPSEDGVSTEVIDIKPGLNKFDGHLALAYSRSRHQDSDYFRMNRQRCVIEAMVKQVEPLTVLKNFQTLANVVKDTVMTDIPIDALPQLVDLKPILDLENLVSIRFIPPEYHLKYRDDGKPGRVPNIPLIHEHVALAISDPARAIQELGLERLEDACGKPDTAAQ